MPNPLGNPNPPFVAQLGIELTNRCNLACVQCLRTDLNDPPLDFPFELLESLIEQAKPFGINHMAFTGGEPTIYPRFFDVVDLLARHGWGYHFVTNGSRFPDMLPQLMTPERWPSFQGVAFSLDGATEDTHDRNRGKGSFRQVMKAMSVAAARGVPYSVQMVVNAWNRHELEAMALLASHLQASRLFYTYLQPTPAAVAADLCLTPKEWKQVGEDVDRLMETFRLPILKSAGHHYPHPLYQCQTVQYQSFNVNYKGEFTFCCQLSGFNDDGASVAGKPDFVADLTTTPFAEAYQRFVTMVHGLNAFKAQKVADGTFKGNDYFPCHFCERYFKKVDWLKRDHADHPWVAADDPAQQPV
jgi:MoaA/NifB/PqqE/SkfB family radical SAM enzyme